MAIIFTRTTTTIAREFIESITIERLELHLSRISRESGVEFDKQGNDNTNVRYSLTGHWDAINIAYLSLSTILRESSNCLQNRSAIEMTTVNLSDKKVCDFQEKNESQSHELMKQNKIDSCISIKKEPLNDYWDDNHSQLSTHSGSDQFGINHHSANNLFVEKQADFIPESQAVKVETETEHSDDDTEIDENYLSNCDDDIESSNSSTENDESFSDDKKGLRDATFVKTRKMRIYGPGDFQCKLCPYVGKTKEYLKRHMQRHNFRFTCDICNKGFGFKSEYVRHYEAHIKRKKKQGEDKAEYACDMCSYVTPTKQRFKAHMKRMHIKDFSCNICGKGFGTASGLSRHENSVHSAPQYSCDKCPKIYKDKRSIIEHLKTHAEDYVEPNFPCDICGKSYKSKSSLNEHTLTHSDGYVKPNIPCDICGKSFSQKCALTQHIKSDHLGIKKAFMCPTCGKSCKSKTAYMAHAAVHLGIKPYICDECGKAFSDERILKGHKEIHNPDKRFQCNVCEKSFKHRTGLRVHLKVHTESKDFMCTTCGKGFTQKQALERHERIHSGAKPYLCSFCNKSFNDTSIIRRHMILVHKKQPEHWRDGVIEEIEKVSSQENNAEISAENVIEGEDEIKSLEKWCYENPPIEYRWNKLEIADKLYQQTNLINALNINPHQQLEQVEKASDSSTIGLNDIDSF